MDSYFFLKLLLTPDSGGRSGSVLQSGSDSARKSAPVDGPRTGGCGLMLVWGLSLKGVRLKRHMDGAEGVRGGSNGLGRVLAERRKEEELVFTQAAHARGFDKEAQMLI